MMGLALLLAFWGHQASMMPVATVARPHTMSTNVPVTHITNTIPFRYPVGVSTLNWQLEHSTDFVHWMITTNYWYTNGDVWVTNRGGTHFYRVVLYP